jgi:hypothetical protein
MNQNYVLTEGTQDITWLANQYAMLLRNENAITFLLQNTNRKLLIEGSEEHSI